MSREKKALGVIVIALIFLSALIGCLWVLSSPHGQTVQIVQDGLVLYTLDLSAERNRTIQVEYDGRVNTIQIENGKIRMLDADCPDHACIQMGWLDSLAPIVCLPNHLVIQFTDAEPG